MVALTRKDTCIKREGGEGPILASNYSLIQRSLNIHCLLCASTY